MNFAVSVTCYMTVDNYGCRKRKATFFLGWVRNLEKKVSNPKCLEIFL